jgi:flagellar L-ring protein FlgH
MRANCVVVTVQSMGWASLMLLATCVNAGSLVDANQYQALVADKRAQNVGDIVTVLVLENATASSRAMTDASSQTDADIFGKDGRSTISLSGGISAEGLSSGRTGRSGEFRAHIAAVITEQAENGMLSIAAQQEISINGEAQKISLTGQIRPVDIGPANTITSNRIANGKISLIGNGVVDRAQRQGLIMRLMKWLRLV